MENRDTRLIPLAWKYRARCASLDLTSHPVLVWISALLRFAVGRLLWTRRPHASFVILSRAHSVLLRVWGQSSAIRWLNRKIETALAKACREEGLVRSLSLASARGVLDSALSAGIVLKAPCLQAGNVVERGVLLLKYSDRIAAFHQSVNMQALLRHYDLVLEPSWTGYASLDLLAFARYPQHTIVLLSPFQGDREFLRSLGSNLIPIELGPGDWVDPRIFRPLEGEPKRYDVVMIARWNFTKRHDLLLRALRQIADPTFRVALVAQNLPRDSDREGALMAMDSSGLRRQIDVFEDLAPADVNRVLNLSKVNVLLSRQEGGNRGLFEGFFAGVPGVAFRNHIGVRTENFQPETGRLIERDRLAEELLYFREHWSAFNPRPWALSHIAPEISARRLNEFLKHQSLERGQPWSRDIVMKCNGPHLRYYPDDGIGQRLPAMEDVLTQFRLGSAAGQHA